GWPDLDNDSTDNVSSWGRFTFDVTGSGEDFYEPYTAPVVSIDVDAIIVMVDIVVQIAVVMLFLGIAFKMLGNLKI
ncbi:unnamed protein product, partial [marine sediment metagenome]